MCLFDILKLITTNLCKGKQVQVARASGPKFNFKGKRVYELEG